jgi:hypothetical protein
VILATIAEFQKAEDRTAFDIWQGQMGRMDERSRLKEEERCVQEE